MLQKDQKAVAPPPNGILLRGQAPEPLRTPATLLRMDPRHQFSFLFHPACWDIHIHKGEPKIVPRLREFHYEPGLAGVRPVKRQFDGDPGAALVAQAERGWRAIPQETPCVAWGEKHDRYLHKFEGHRGPVYLSVWHQPYLRGGGHVIDFDREGWTAFLVSLLESKIVPPPDRMARRALQVDFEKQCANLQTSGDRSAVARLQAELYEEKLQVFQVLEGGKKTTEDLHTLKPTPEPTPEPTPVETLLREVLLRLDTQQKQLDAQQKQLGELAKKAKSEEKKPESPKSGNPPGGSP